MIVIEEDEGRLIYMYIDYVVLWNKREQQKTKITLIVVKKRERESSFGCFY